MSSGTSNVTFNLRIARIPVHFASRALEFTAVNALRRIQYRGVCVCKERARVSRQRYTNLNYSQTSNIPNKTLVEQIYCCTRLW
jgi:hypothetical protein